jgi:hypothetical protein
MVALWLPAFDRVAEASLRTQAWLRCTYTALAAERYRRAHKLWPDSLDALVAAKLLRQMPIDPYDGKPLRLARLTEGLIIYSIGPDGVDNGGKLDRKNPVAVGSDLGFQLWEVKHRNKPAPGKRPRVGTEDK